MNEIIFIARMVDVIFSKKKKKKVKKIKIIGNFVHPSTEYDVVLTIKKPNEQVFDFISANISKEEIKGNFTLVNSDIPFFILADDINNVQESMVAISSDEFPYCWIYLNEIEDSETENEELSLLPERPSDEIRISLLKYQYKLCKNEFVICRRNKLEEFLNIKSDLLLDSRPDRHFMFGEFEEIAYFLSKIFEANTLKDPDTEFIWSAPFKTSDIPECTNLKELEAIGFVVKKASNGKRISHPELNWL